MDRPEYTRWLERARSALKLAREGKVEGVFLEDLCFQAQQAAEKALKALLLRHGDEFPKTHSIGVLLQLVQEHEAVPEGVDEAIDLTDYAVQARYPGDYYPVDEEEYERSVQIATRVVDWVADVLADE